jgi:hypothetical protein
MSRVLILDADTTLTSAVSRCLREAGLEVVERHRAAELAPRGAFDVVLLDWTFRDVLAHVGDARAFVMLSYADPALERELARRFTLIRKPFTSVELLSLLRQELGPLALPHPRLLDALRDAHAHRSDVRLVVGAGAEVQVVRGEIFDARAGGLRGEPALRVLLTRGERARAEPLAGPGMGAVDRTVYRRFQRLLLDLLHQIDEAEQRR